MSSNIYAREEEISVLNTLTGSSKPEFLAIYGRRRVGKTFLIKEYFKQQKNVIFFRVTGLRKGNLKVQIANFTSSIGDVFYGGALLQVPSNWNQAFFTLHQAMKKSTPDQKIILFFDELPWMVTRNSKLLESLDYYWNHYWSDDARVKLIVCGSSSSWIIKKIINDKGGFHNRITHKLHLSPFTLKDTKTFLKCSGVKLNNQQVLLLYMAIGGIPYYLTHVEKGLSAAQIIEKLAFSQKSLLLEEFENLFAALFEQCENHIAVLRMIANTQYGLAQKDLLGYLDKALQGQSGLDILNQLEEADFIMSFKPHFHKKRGKYYRVIDEYTLFYFKWIEPIKDTLQEHALEVGYWQAIQNTIEWNVWSGYAFESICYKHISQIRKALKIPVTAIADTYRYVPRKKEDNQGAQIDLLFDRRDDAMTLCEIKYSQKPYILTKEYTQALIRKADVLKKQTRTQKQIFWTFIAANGLKPNFYVDEFVTGVVVLDDFFK